MSLTAFQRNSLNTRIDTLLNILPKASKDQPLKDQVIIAYQIKVLSALKTILKERKHDKPLKAFLADNWNFVKNTAVCYTALPHNDTTKILCDIANALSDTENPAITLLMPGMSTAHLADEKKDLDTMDLENILKTHILGDNASYLIPVTLIVEIAHAEDLSKIYNPYFNYSLHPTNTATLSTAELARLFQHSDHTQAIANLKKSYDDIANDQSHLLGQLKKLISLMGFNSSHNGGIGTSEIAAKGGFIAIAEFFEFFNQLPKKDIDSLPESIKKELAILINLAESGGQKKEADGNLVTQSVTRKVTKRDRDGNTITTEETVVVPIALLNNADYASCLGTRKEGLTSAILGHEKQLAAISLSAEQRSHLLSVIQQKLMLALQNFETALSTSYVGSDPLCITAKLLNGLDIDFNPRSFEEISGIFKFLNKNELEELLTLEDAAKKIITAIGTLENFVMLIHELSAEKLGLLLSKTKRQIKRSIVKDNSENISSLLTTLDRPDNFEKLIILFTLINTAQDVYYALEPLNNDQRTAIFNAFQTRFLTLIKTADDFQDILANLNIEQRTAMYNACQKQLPNLIKTSLDFRYILEYLTSEQRTVIYNRHQKQLSTFIKTPMDFHSTIFFLNAKERTAFYDAHKKQLPRLIKTAYDFQSILAYLTPKQRTEVYRTCQKRFPRLIKSEYDLYHLLKHLTPNQCSEVFKARQKRSPSLIKNAGNFITILTRLEPEQRTAVYNAYRQQLHHMNINLRDFRYLTNLLTTEEQIDLCKHHRKVLPSAVEKEINEPRHLYKLEALFLQWAMLVSDLQNCLAKKKITSEVKNMASSVLLSLMKIDLSKINTPHGYTVGLFQPVKNHAPETFTDRAQQLIRDYNAITGA